MTKQELTTLLRSVGVNENTITAMENAYDMGVEHGTVKEREECHALRQTLMNPYTDCQVSAHACDMAFVEYGKAIRARGEPTSRGEA